MHNIFSCDEELRKWHCHLLRLFICLFVRSQGFFLSSHFLSLESFQWCSRNCIRCFIEVHGCFKSFKGRRFKQVTRLIHMCFKSKVLIFSTLYSIILAKYVNLESKGRPIKILTFWHMTSYILTSYVICPV